MIGISLAYPSDENSSQADNDANVRFLKAAIKYTLVPKHCQVKYVINQIFQQKYTVQMELRQRRPPTRISDSPLAYGQSVSYHGGFRKRPEALPSGR